MQLAQKKMAGKWIPDHQKNNLQLNLLSSHKQLYILSERNGTHMQDSMLWTKCRAETKERI